MNAGIGWKFSIMNTIPTTLMLKTLGNFCYQEVNIISFTNEGFIAGKLDLIEQVYPISHTYTCWCRKTYTRNGLWYQIYPTPSGLLENNMCTVCALVNQQSALHQRRRGRKGMKGQQGRQPGTEKEIVFALSMFAQFSAGQILARVLSSRSSLLGSDLAPCPQRLKDKKKIGKEGKVEDGWKSNS